MAGYVVGQLGPRDKHTYEVLTGKLQFYADQWGGKRYFGAILGSSIAYGGIKMVGPGGRVGSINVSNGGSNYTTTPTVTITGGGGSGATAKASIHNGQVVQVTLINRGDGYGSAPSVMISGGGGSGASATATITALEPSMDKTAALAEPGVRAVLDYLDARGNKTSNNFLTSTWGFCGAPIAAVVADDWHTAMRACGLIKVEYDANPWVVGINEAMKPDAPLAVGTNQGGPESPNINDPAFTYRPSSLNATSFTSALEGCAFQADHEQGYTTDYAHNMLEPHGQTAWWIGDHCYIWTGTQNLHSCHNTFCGDLVRSTNGLAYTVHTFSQGTGGGHGDKTGANCGGLAARMSLFVDGAPVTLVQPRCNNIVQHSRQTGSKQIIKIGGNASRKIVAFETTTIAASGFAGGGGLSLTGINQSYVIPNMRTRQRVLRMNRPSRGPWRCVGDPPSCMGYDAAIDKLAYRMGITPYALRMENLRDYGAELPPGFVYGTGTGEITPYQGLELTTILKTVHDASNYDAKYHLPKEGPARADGRKHGIGLGVHVDSHGGVSGSGRNMNLVASTNNSTPQAFILGGFGRGPSGAPSAMASIVAETMGLAYENVWVTDFGHSDKTWPSGNQAGSGFTSGAGGAAYNMAYKARQEILTLAMANAAFATLDAPAGRTVATATANVVDGRVTSVTITNGGAGYTGVPRVTFTNATGATTAGVSAVASVADGKVVHIGVTSTGSGLTYTPNVVIGWLSTEDFDPRNNTIYLKGASTPTLAINSVLGNTSLAWWGQPWVNTRSGSSAGSSGACAEVLVDEETGEIEVTGIWNCVDTGGTIFKRGAIKEMYSGCELIISQTLFYGDVYDNAHTGALIGTHWTQSQCPTAMDLPTNAYWAKDIESGDVGPYGAHGIGEPAVSNVSAINCAIYNAIGFFVDPEDGAMNPDRVLKALGKG